MNEATKDYMYVEDGKTVWFYTFAEAHRTHVGKGPIKFRDNNGTFHLVEDIAGQERLHPPRRRQRTPQDLLEDVQFLLSWGTHPAVVCTTVGKSPAALEKFTKRHGFEDLAKIFMNERTFRERRAA